jgi:hypothetical protein
VKRFLVGLILGVVAGFVAWFVSDGNWPVTIFVGALVALIVWFTKIADDIADWALDVGKFID